MKGTEMFTILKFAGLIALYVGFSLIAIRLIVPKENRKRPGKRLNHWFWTWVIFSVGLVIFALQSDWGPALLLPKELPTPEQRRDSGQLFARMLYGTNGSREAVFSRLLHGTNAPAKSVQPETPAKVESWKKPLPWTTGSPFWIWSAIFFALAIFPFGIIAYTDEMEGFVKERKKVRDEKRKELLTEKKQGHGHHEEEKGAKEESHFWKLDFWDMVGLTIEAVRMFKKH